MGLTSWTQRLLGNLKDYSWFIDPFPPRDGHCFFVFVFLIFVFVCHLPQGRRPLV